MERLAVKQQDMSEKLCTDELEKASLKHLPIPVIVISSDLTLNFANESARRLFGIANDENLIGFPPSYLGASIVKDGQTSELLDFLSDAQRRWRVVRSAAEKAAKSPDDPVLQMFSAPATYASPDLDDEYWMSDAAQDPFVQTANIIISRKDLPEQASKQGLPTRNRPIAAKMTIKNISSGRHIILSLERLSKFEHASVLAQGGKPVGSIQELHSAKPSEERKGALNTLFRLNVNLFNSIKRPAYFLSADEKSYFPNKAMQTLLGEDSDLLIGHDGYVLMSMYAVWDESFEHQIPLSQYPAIRLVRQQENFANMTCGFIHLGTGKKMVIDVRGECVFDQESGEFLGGLCILNTVEDFEELSTYKEERWQRSHETICNLLPNFVWTTTPDGSVDYYSNRWYEYTGLSKEESLGFGFKKVVHEDDLSFVLSRYMHALTSGEECACELRYRRHDGIYRWMLAKIAPLKDSISGEVKKWYGTNTDIHDLVLARMEQQHIKEQMLALLAHADIHLFAMDRRACLTMSEGSMQWQANNHDSGKKDSLIGMNLFDILSGTKDPEGCSPSLQAATDVLHGKKSLSISETKILDRHFRTLFLADPTCDLLPDSPGLEGPYIMPTLGISFDITDLKTRTILEVENTRLQVKEQTSREANMMKSRFLANMSHEIRTPLSGIIGMIELLSSGHKYDKEQQECLDGVRLSADALLAIVNDILDFSKIESGRLDLDEIPANLSESVAEFSRIFSFSAIQKGLRYVFNNHLESDLYVMTDTGRVRQVLGNVLGNAIKFTGQGGRVTLTASSKRINGSDMAHFTVQDDGVGIKAETLKTLFRPYMQGDSSTARIFGGSGLGLAISKSLVNLMGGTLWLESEFGAGTTAILNIPLKRITKPMSNGITDSHKSTAPGESALINGLASTSLEKADEKPNILLVEDNVINQKIAMKFLKNLGYPAKAVWNGQEALDYLKSLSDNGSQAPGIILMDCQMPILDGYGCTRSIRDGERFTAKSHIKEIPIVAMTASAIQGDKEKCFAAGMSDYLSKPVKQTELKDMLVKWTDSRVPR